MIYFLYYILITYLVGFVVFAVELRAALKKEQYYLVTPGIIIFALSPLTAWHGTLHYLQVGWCKLTKQPLKFWI